jgi:hypothetical protein
MGEAGRGSKPFHNPDHLPDQPQRVLKFEFIIAINVLRMILAKVGWGYPWQFK